VIKKKCCKYKNTSYKYGLTLAIAGWCRLILSHLFLQWVSHHVNSCRFLIKKLKQRNT